MLKSSYLGVLGRLKPDEKNMVRSRPAFMCYLFFLLLQFDGDAYLSSFFDVFNIAGNVSHIE